MSDHIHNSPDWNYHKEHLHNRFDRISAFGQNVLHLNFETWKRSCCPTCINHKYPYIQLVCLHIEYLSPDKTYVLQPEEEYVKDMQEHSRMLANPSQWIDRFMRSMRSSITYSQKIEDILRQDICKINCRMMENEDTHDLVAYLEEHKDVFVNAPSGKGLFEITDAKTNKATAVRWLAEYLNVTKDEVAVYGDGGNDLDMLAMFPHSYAPAAAQERAKTAASAVIGPYEEYSVARHMEKLLLLQK